MGFDHVGIFVNSTGENELVREFLKTTDLISNPKIIGLDESLPAYTAIPDPSRKSRLEEIIKNSNDREIEALRALIPKATVERLHGRFPESLVGWIERSDIDFFVKQSIPCDGDYGNASKGDIKLTRQSSKSLLMLHQEITPSQPILIAVPPAHNDDSGLKLGIGVLEAGIRWAQILAAPLHLIRAWELFGEDLLNDRLSDEELGKSLDEELRHHREDFEKIQQQVPDAKELEAHFIKGHPTRVLNEQIDKLQPSLVVMGSVANSGLKGALLGNTAETILRQKKTSVFVVK